MTSIMWPNDETLFFFSCHHSSMLHSLGDRHVSRLHDLEPERSRTCLEASFYLHVLNRLKWYLKSSFFFLNNKDVILTCSVQLVLHRAAQILLFSSSPGCTLLLAHKPLICVSIQAWSLGPTSFLLSLAHWLWLSQLMRRESPWGAETPVHIAVSWWGLSIRGMGGLQYKGFLSSCIECMKVKCL